MLVPERKSFSFKDDTPDAKKLEYKLDMDKRILEAYATVFDVEDQVKDTGVKGMFVKTIQQRGPKNINGQVKSKIKVGYNHEVIVGLPLVMEEDSKGLFTRSRIDPTSDGNDVLIKIDSGTVDQMSYTYDVISKKDKGPKPIKGGNRFLYEVKMYEYGPQDFACLEDDLIVGLAYKSLNPLAIRTLKEEIEELEHKFGSIEKLAEVFSEVKAGRAISTRNRSMLEGAITSFQTGIDSLRELLVSNDQADVEEMQEDEQEKEQIMQCIGSIFDMQMPSMPSSMVKSSPALSPELKSLEPLLNDYLGISKSLRKTG